MPKPCDTAAGKTAETLPTERTKKLESPAARFVPKPCDTAGRKTAETLPTERIKKLEFPASKAFGEAQLPKEQTKLLGALPLEEGGVGG